MELFSNRVLAHFVSRIDEEINGVAWELKVCQWRKRERALVCLVSSEPLEKK
jgi:hypothetical protein